MSTLEDWLLRPVGTMCKYESLLDGTLDLLDIWRMNEKMNVDAENERRLTEAATRRG